VTIIQIAIAWHADIVSDEFVSVCYVSCMQDTYIMLFVLLKIKSFLLCNVYGIKSKMHIYLSLNYLTIKFI